MRRALPWLLVAVLVGLLVWAAKTGLELRGLLAEVVDSAETGAAEARRSGRAADSLLLVVRDRDVAIRRLLVTRDSLRSALVGRVASIPSRPLAPPAEACGLWVARADSLAGALALAQAALTTSDTVVESLAASVGDLRSATDTLRPALETAGDRLAGIASAIPSPLLVVPRAKLSAFGQASLGLTGARVELGIERRGLYAAVEDGPAGRSLRIGYRREFRLF